MSFLCKFSSFTFTCKNAFFSLLLSLSLFSIFPPADYSVLKCCSCMWCLDTLSSFIWWCSSRRWEAALSFSQLQSERSRSVGLNPSSSLSSSSSSTSFFFIFSLISVCLKQFLSLHFFSLSFCPPYFLNFSPPFSFLLKTLLVQSPSLCLFLFPIEFNEKGGRLKGKTVSSCCSSLWKKRHVREREEEEKKSRGKREEREKRKKKDWDPLQEEEGS